MNTNFLKVLNFAQTETIASSPSVDNSYLIGAIIVMALVMLGLRAFPFLIFGGGGKPSKLTLYLGHVMSPAAVAMLVIYCICGHLNELNASSITDSLPVFVGVVFVAGIHLLFHNMLISVFGGTIFYMVILQSGILTF